MGRFFLCNYIFKADFLYTHNTFNVHFLNFIIRAFRHCAKAHGFTLTREGLEHLRSSSVAVSGGMSRARRRSAQSLTRKGHAQKKIHKKNTKNETISLYICFESIR